MAALTIAANLTLPLDTVTQTIAILGIRGSGKTHTASVVTEGMLEQRQHVVIIDPLDAWWGLRASADGKGAGLPITIIGGAHGDIALEASAGAVIADVVVDHRLSCVLSLRHLSKTAQRRFVAEFAERLYHRKGEDANRLPLHVVIDEADAFVPQRVAGDTARVMGAVDDLVRRGRSSGFGVTLITQRPATIHKDVLTQADILVAHRLVSPQDRKALEAWIEAHDADNRAGEFMASLASLEPGTAWFWSPGWLGMFEKIAVRPRTTFDSSATPKAGERVTTPPTFAPVDLDVLRERIAATVEESKTDDPKLLKARIQALERERSTLPVTAPERVIERIEVPIFDDEARAQLGRIAQRLDEMASTLPGMRNEVSWMLEHLARPAVETVAATPITPIASNRPARVSPQPSSQPLSPPSREGEAKLRHGERLMLRTLARLHPRSLTRQQLGTLSGYSHSGGTFGNYLGTLKRTGFVEDHRGTLAITSAGFDYLGGDYPAPPATTDELIGLWCEPLRRGERQMLDALVDRYPGWMSRDDLADETGFTASGGTFGNYLGTLRRNGLIEEQGRAVRASADLFEEMAA